jgi:hypothetical protein
MKEIIALFLFLCITGITLYTSITKQIDAKLTIIFLCFSVISGLSIANYDVIQKVSFQGMEIQTFKGQVTKIKQEAIDDIRRDVESQKKALTDVAGTMTKMAFVLADGSGRWGGFPETHLKQIQQYRASLHQYIDPNLDKEISQTLLSLEMQIKKKQN